MGVEPVSGLKGMSSMDTRRKERGREGQVGGADVEGDLRGRMWKSY